MTHEDSRQGDRSREQSATDPSQTGFSPTLDWEETFQRNVWDYLGEVGETPRYAVVAGYIHKLLPRGRILDVGCGEGVLLDYLDPERIDYSGFDISPTAVTRARRINVDAKITVGSMDDFKPAENETYEIIVFNESLQSVRQPIETLRRFFGFLTPSGHIIISLFHNRNPESVGALCTRSFKAEIQAGRVNVIAASEVLNCESGLKWTIYCLGRPRTIETFDG